MVTVTKEHSSKQHVEQDFREASHNPNKLGPSRRLTSRLRVLRRRRTVARCDNAGKARAAVGGGRHSDVVATDEGDIDVPGSAVHGAGDIRRFCAGLRVAVQRARSDSCTDSEDPGIARAIAVLALSAIAARQRPGSDSLDAASDARTCLCSSERRIGGGNDGYGYDGAHAVRESNGSAEELQPEEQGEEELSPYPDLRSGDARVAGALRLGDRPTGRVPAGDTHYKDKPTIAFTQPSSLPAQSQG